MPEPRYELDAATIREIVERLRARPTIETRHEPVFVGYSPGSDQLYEEVVVEDFIKVGFDATEADEIFTATGHGLAEGDAVALFLPVGGIDDFPEGVTATTDPTDLTLYTVETVPDADTFTLVGVDVTADGEGYFVRLIDGRLMYPGRRQEYDQFAEALEEDPDWVDQDDVWIMELNDKALTVGDRMPARRHGDAGPEDDRRVLYSVYHDCCVDDIDGGTGGGGTPVICGESLPTTLYGQLQKYDSGVYGIDDWPSFGASLGNLTFSWNATYGCYTCDTDITISDGVGGTTEVKSWVVYESVSAGTGALAVFGALDDLASQDLSFVVNDPYNGGTLSPQSYHGSCSPTHMLGIFAVFTNGNAFDLLAGGCWCLLLKLDAW
jgi:hypothetical protein